MITHIYPNQNLLSTQQKRKNLFRRFRDAFINVQSNGVVTLRQEFIDLDKKINDNNFEVDGWAFRAFWHSCGFTESEMEFFFQECAKISAAQLSPSQNEHGEKQFSPSSNDESNSNNISVDLAEAAVFVRRSLDCRRQQLHDILKRIRVKKLHPKNCPFVRTSSSKNKNKNDCSRLVVFDYLTKEGGLTHSEAFLLMDACSTPKQQQHHQNKPSFSNSHNIGSGNFHPENPQFHQPPLSPVNQTNTKDAEIDLGLLTSCIFVFPLPDSVAFSLLLGKVVDALCDSFRGAGPTGVTSIVNAVARLVTRSTPEELEEWLRDQSNISENHHHHPNPHIHHVTTKRSNNNNNNEDEKSFEIRLNVENFVQVCNSIAAGMPRAECILLHSFLADEEESEKNSGRNNNNLYEEAIHNYQNDQQQQQPTVSLRKFISAVQERIPILSESAFNVTIAEARHHTLGTSGGFSGLFQSLVRPVRESGQVLDRSGALEAFRSINVSSVFLPDITIEQIVTHFLVRNRNFLLQHSSSASHQNVSSSSLMTSTSLFFLRSFVETLRGRVSLGRMEIVEKLFHRLTEGALTSQIKMLSSLPTSSNNGDNFETTRENRRKAIASLLDQDEFEMVMGEIDSEELARRRQMRDTALYQPLLRASDLLACFAPDLVSGGGGSQRTKLQKTAMRCQRDLRNYLKTLEKLSKAIEEDINDDGQDDDEDNEDYFMDEDISHNPANYSISRKIILSLADFGFFWANFAMTVQDDSEFTIILWEGFSMHKALSGTSANHHKKNNTTTSSSSTLSTPRRTGGGRTPPTTPKSSHKIHAKFVGENTNNDQQERYNNNDFNENGNDNDNDQSNDLVSNSSPPTGIAALIAASHEEERKRRLHIERLATNNNNERRKSPSPSNNFNNSPTNHLQQQDQQQSSGNSKMLFRNNSPIPKYHHHYRQLHAHEEDQEQQHYHQNNDISRSSPNNNLINEGSSLVDSSTTYAYSSNLNPNNNNNNNISNQPQRGPAHDRSQDVVAEFEKRQKLQQDKYKLWDDAAEKGPYSPTANKNANLEKQNPNNNNNEPLYPGYDRGRKRVVNVASPTASAYFSYTAQKNEDSPSSSSPSGSQNNNNTNISELQQEYENNMNQQNHQLQQQKEGQIVGYTEDGRPIVSKKVILPNYNNSSPQSNQFHHHQDPYDGEMNQNDDDNEEENFYNDDENNQDYYDQPNMRGSQRNSPSTSYRPELAEAVDLMVPSESDPRSQHQHNRNTSSAQRKRLPTALEAYRAGEEKLMKDIAAFHHQRPNTGRASKNFRKNHHHEDEDEETSNRISTRANHSDNVILVRRSKSRSPPGSSRGDDTNANVVVTNSKKNRFQGFLPTFGSPGLGWNSNAKNNNLVGHDEQQNEEHEQESLHRVQKDPLHPDICRKKFIKPPKKTILFQEE